jgi:hypothetical protein
MIHLALTIVSVCILIAAAPFVFFLGLYALAIAAVVAVAIGPLVAAIYYFGALIGVPAYFAGLIVVALAAGYFHDWNERAVARRVQLAALPAQPAKPADWGAIGITFAILGGALVGSCGLLALAIHCGAAV